MANPAYKRILLKVSSEVMGPEPFGIDLATVGRLADEIIACADQGAQIACVLHQAEEGTAVGEVCRPAGISAAGQRQV